VAFVKASYDDVGWHGNVWSGRLMCLLVRSLMVLTCDYQMTFINDGSGTYGVAFGLVHFRNLWF